VVVKSMRKGIILSLGIVLVSFLLAFYFYNRVPDKIANHWDINGNVNGYTTKLSGLFLVPSILLVCVSLFLLLPKIDPLRKNIASFKVYYDIFILIFTGFMFYIYILMILWNLNYRFDMLLMMFPGMSVLFYYCGIMLERSKRNWFIGIRTPWTMSNDVVWDKTHKLGGRLFKIAGIIILIGALFKGLAIIFFVLSILIASVLPVFYSYFEYRKQVNKK
jgi:uncharacterized membrane protein